MKIVFIQAEGPGSIADFSFPAGIAALEAILTKAGHQVDLLWRVAGWLTLDKTGKRLRELDPNMICISFCFTSMQDVEKLVPVAREACPGARIVIGGPGVTFCPEFALWKTGANYGIIGEGERILSGLVYAPLTISEESREFYPSGLAYWDENRAEDGIAAVKTTGGSGETMPLEDIPLPSWDKYPMHWYMRTGDYMYRSMASSTDRLVNWIASRGCVQNCNFCASGCKPRYKKMDHLEYELREIQERFHPTFLAWMDNLTIASKKYCLEFCEMIRRNNFGWRYYVTGLASAMDEEMLRALKESGCAGILYGVESANDNVLEFINKGITIEQFTQAIRLTKEAGIRPQISAMFGQPVETAEDFQRTIAFVIGAFDKNLPTSNNQGLSPVMTFPGTSLYRWAMEKGYFENEQDYYDQFFRDERYHFINYTGIKRDDIIGFHRVARALNDWNYHHSTASHYQKALNEVGIKVPF